MMTLVIDKVDLPELPEDEDEEDEEDVDQRLEDMMRSLGSIAGTNKAGTESVDNAAISLSSSRSSEALPHCMSAHSIGNAPRSSTEETITLHP